MDYAAGKFRASNHFDIKDTVKQMKDEVLHYRRIEHLTKEEARQIFNEIIEVEEHCAFKDEYAHFVGDCRRIMGFFNGMPPFSGNNIEPGFRNFWHKVWPHFLQHLESEKVVA